MNWMLLNLPLAAIALVGTVLPPLLVVAREQRDRRNAAADPA